MTLRTLVMGGNPGRWNYRNPAPPYRIANGVEAWVGALCGDWIGRTPASRQEIQPYDLVIANLNPPLIPAYLDLMKHRPTHQKWVALVEGCGFDYLDPSPALLQMLAQCDLVANINRHTTAYFRHLSPTRVEWIGIPYPARAVQAFATPSEQQRLEVLVCPRQQRKPSFVVAEALGAPVRAYFQKVSRTPRNLPLYLRYGYFKRDLRAHFWLQEAGPTPRIADIERDMPTFWREAGGCRLWVNMDPRYTWARFVLDAAALGVPIIATESTAHAGALFPETTVRDVFCIEEAITIGRRLLADEALRLRVIRTAQAGLEEFTPERCVQRLAEALGVSRENLTGDPGVGEETQGAPGEKGPEIARQAMAGPR